MSVVLQLVARPLDSMITRLRRVEVTRSEIAPSVIIMIIIDDTIGNVIIINRPPLIIIVMMDTTVPLLLPLHLQNDIGVIVVLLSAHEGHAVVAAGRDHSVIIISIITIVAGRAAVQLEFGLTGFAIEEAFEFGHGEEILRFG